MAQVDHNFHLQHAAGRRGPNRRQAFSQGRRGAPLDESCACAHCARGNGGQLLDPFADHEFLSFVGDRRCYSEAPGGLSSSRADPSRQQQSLRGCEGHCCAGGSSALLNHRGSISEADSVIDRMRASLNGSRYSSGELPRCASACGCTQPSLSKNGDMRSASLDPSAIASFPTSGQATTGCREQVCLHDWYLMKPKCGENSPDCSSIPRVAIGGYRTPDLLAADFVQTALIEQRLKRWKLRTIDGVEVTLMGMVNMSKSIACGFSPVLVQYFLMGFPATWIYMLLNLSSGPLKGLKPDFHSRSGVAGPPSEVQSQDRNDTNKENRRLGEANSVPCEKASLFSASADEGTWRAQLLRSSITGNALRDGLGDVHLREQCQLDKGQSDSEANCFGLDAMTEPSLLHQQTLSEDRDGPCFGPEAAELSADALNGPADSDQRRKSVGLWDCLNPTPDDDVVDVPLEEQRRSKDGRESTLVTVSAGLTNDGFVSENATEFPDCGTQSDKQPACTDSPHSAVNSSVAGEVPRSACASADRAQDDQGHPARKPEDSGQNHREVSRQADSLGPCTPIQKAREPAQSDTPSIIVVDETIAEAGTAPVGSPQIMGSGRILRSGRYLPTSEALLERSSVAPESSSPKAKIRKRPRTPTAANNEDGTVFASEGFVSRPDETLGEHEVLGCMGQVPRTQVETTELPFGHNGSVLDGPTCEQDPSSAVQDLEPSKTRRRGRVPKADKNKPKKVVDPLNSLQTMESRKRLRSYAVHESLIRSNTTGQVVTEVFPYQRSDGDLPSCNAEAGDAINIQRCPTEKQTSPKTEILSSNKDSQQSILREDKDTQQSVPCENEDSEQSVPCENEDSQQSIPDKGTSQDPEILTKEDQVCEKSRGPTRRSTKKGHRRCNIYGSRRRKSEPKSSTSCREKQESKQESKVDKVGSLKSADKVENAGNAGQISKATRSRVVSVSVRSNVDQVGENCKSVKKEGRSRQSQILPPPLPTPLVPNKTKVTKAFGLKRSRYGRVLVPTLANWCNQTIQYDMDGSIIAISDGVVSEIESNTGCFKFPTDRGSRAMQRRCQRAADNAWTRP